MDVALLLALCFLVLAPEAARADVVVLVPPHAESGLGPDVIERVTDATTRSLRVDGFSVVSAGQASALAQTDPEASDALENCVSPECAYDFRRMFDATFAVQVSLFRSEKGLASIKVTLVEDAHTYFTGASEVEGGDIEGAVRQAYKRARELQAEGIGPWLSVDGSPHGAKVYVDGLEFGKIPITRRRISAGDHAVEVRSDGHATLAQRVDVPARLDHDEKLVVHLESFGASRARRRHLADWIVGGVLTAGGLVYAASGTRDFLIAGDCAERVMGECVEEHTTNTTSKLKLGLGAAAAAVGIFTMAYGPIGVMTTVDRTSASLRLRMQF